MTAVSPVTIYSQDQESGRLATVIFAKLVEFMEVDYLALPLAFNAVIATIRSDITVVKFPTVSDDESDGYSYETAIYDSQNVIRTKSPRDAIRALLSKYSFKCSMRLRTDGSLVEIIGAQAQDLDRDTMLEVVQQYVRQNNEYCDGLLAKSEPCSTFYEYRISRSFEGNVRYTKDQESGEITAYGDMCYHVDIGRFERRYALAIEKGLPMSTVATFDIDYCYFDNELPPLQRPGFKAALLGPTLKYIICSNAEFLTDKFTADLLERMNIRVVEEK